MAKETETERMWQRKRTQWTQGPGWMGSQCGYFLIYTIKGNQGCLGGRLRSPLDVSNFLPNFHIEPVLRSENQ